MTNQMSRLRPAFAWAALGVLLAAGVAQSATALRETGSIQPPDAKTAQQMFADAPDGVDPIVTGPVSAAFKQRQKAAHCDTAVWPNIPATCYPD
ncbi:MAG: hypothetical protein E5X74_18045 [Mesorhizobium sp.]|nr:MAG: hypothetical protein EOR74_20660 [Mesorhizobium sp.]RWM32257.1 MAG: hypothetical protein EOR75_29560 [Mesorhizobium sp.]TIO75109.1 MAG: hypothetical protein E5X75_20610 [Mesorhizobium sp.]TIO83910.1 MAG: hypothetical protein E5X74_18045 [Mesorhizobium sp.]TJV48877.1 MAG: hypothetical protein E5Y01_26445 [Mesorhizobium sp.]